MDRTGSARIRHPGVEMRVCLGERGTTWARVIPAPAGGDTVLALHGWSLTADANWSSSYEGLSRAFGVVAIDHRNHGQGIRSESFSLEDCADDAAALIGRLGLGPVWVVGYSMGGSIGMLLAQRHPDMVLGVVLCATAAHFGHNEVQRLGLSCLGDLGDLGHKSLHALAVHFDGRLAGMAAALDEATRIAMVAKGLAAFDARPWVGSLACPATVIRTTHDHLVPPTDQADLAHLLHAPIIDVAAGHATALVSSDFSCALAAALQEMVGEYVTAARSAAA